MAQGDTELTGSERTFLARLRNNEKLFLVFSVIGVLAGLTILITGLVRDRFDTRLFVIVILILLQARSNLKQHRAAKILKKSNPPNRMINKGF